MTIQDELDQTRRAVQNLEKALTGLQKRLGAHLDVLRLIDDVARCSADLRRLEDQLHPPCQQELVIIPDDDYDHHLWSTGDADHEGVGAAGRRAP